VRTEGKTGFVPGRPFPHCNPWSAPKAIAFRGMVRESRDPAASQSRRVSQSPQPAQVSSRPPTEGMTTPCHAAQPLDIEADEYWASVMRLVKFKYGKIPKPTFPVCEDAGNAASSETVVDAVITQGELNCLPPNPTPGAQNAKLVASAAWTAGVHSG
jgi:hypothetical protein